MGQLKLEEYLEPSALTTNGLSLLPDLLAANEVADVAQSYEAIADSSYAVREEYFVASKKLKSYVTSLPLSSDDLAQMMRSRRISADVKRAIMADPSFVAERLSTRTVTAICDWADTGFGVSGKLLLVLSSAGAPATRILVLLEPLLPDIETHDLDGILRALGDEYELLSQRGHQRPRLKPQQGTEPLLKELQKRDRVSSYKQLPVVGRVQVNMRR